MERAVMCPQCGAPLAPHRFARSIVCAFCGATIRLDEGVISAKKFRETYRVWNAPESYHLASWVSLGSSHWALGACFAHGDLSDVYLAQRARFPTELAIVKLLRDHQDQNLFDHEWSALQMLHQSNARGADVFTMLLPQPILHGDATGGTLTGQRVSIFRWVSGFYHTFERVHQVYPQGIPPRASIWVWRRILEVLSFIHASGMAHGALVPANLLVQENDHGVRLVGYSCAGRLGEKLHIASRGNESFYPKSWSTLSAPLDLVMSARCIVALLGGDPASGSLPAQVPAPLAKVIQRIARAKSADAITQDAWTIREELGQIAKQVFGPSEFFPIVMPR